MDDHFDTSGVFEISKFDIAKFACIAIYDGCKIVNFQMTNCDIFRMFAQNIDRWYKLEPTQ